MWLIIKENPCRFITLTFLAIIIMIPNLQFMAGSSGYYIRYVPFILTIYLIVCAVQLTIKCVNAQLWTELIRLGLLVIICYRLYLFSDIDSYVAIISEQRRVAFVFRTIFVVTTIYLQIGTSIMIKPTSKNLSYAWSVFQYLAIFGPLYAYINYGHFFYNVLDMRWQYLDYYEHYNMLILNACLAVFFTALSKSCQNKKV